MHSLPFTVHWWERGGRGEGGREGGEGGGEIDHTRSPRAKQKSPTYLLCLTVRIAAVVDKPR